jgi:23S rRNA (guanosine2251-2'-O)-methyltransferase
MQIDKSLDKPFYIYGIHTIEEVLKNNTSKIEKIYFDEFLIKKTNNNKLSNLYALVKKLKIPNTLTDKKKLESIISNNNEGSANYQGIIALMRSFDYVDLDDFLYKVKDVKNPCILILDGLEDTHNIGAIARTAVAANVSGMIIHKHSGAPINPTVYKTSSGMITNIPIVKVNNINSTIDKLKNNKYIKFWIYGLDMNSKSNIWQEEYTTPTAFIIGNEEKGISKITLDNCDVIINIPMDKKSESLNASVSASIAIYEWKRQNTNN